MAWHTSWNGMISQNIFGMKYRTETCITYVPHTAIHFTIVKCSHTSYSFYVLPVLQARSQGGSLGAEEPPFQVKGPLFCLKNHNFAKVSTILLKRSTILSKRSTILLKRSTFYTKEPTNGNSWLWPCTSL